MTHDDETHLDIIGGEPTEATPEAAAAAPRAPKPGRPFANGEGPKVGAAQGRQLSVDPATWTQLQEIQAEMAAELGFEPLMPQILRRLVATYRRSRPKEA